MSKANLANAILAAPINTSATSATLVAGYGSTMPAVPFKLTFTPFGQLSTMGNSEIVLVTARSGEVLTIERAKGGTTAKSFETGDIVSNGIYIENSSAVGDIFMSMRTTPAAGRLFMDGGTYNKADWPLLYKLVQDNAAYGTTGGSAGAETFTLADFRERMPFGKSQNSPFTTLGNKSGALTHQHDNGNYQALAEIFTTGTTFYMDYVQSNLVNYQANIRRRVSGGSADESNAEPQNAGIRVGGSSGFSSSMPPYVVVNYEVIAG